LFFIQWWQGVIFGIITTTVLIAIGYALTAMWKPYEDEEENTGGDLPGCHVHH